MEHDDAGLAWEILHRYAAPATARFEAVLAAAGVPEDVARELRFWQRESVANVKHYAAEALPAVFAAITAAQREAGDAARRAAELRDAEGGVNTPHVRTFPVKSPETVIALPEPARGNDDSARLEDRRRTVAVRLAEL